MANATIMDLLQHRAERRHGAVVLQAMGAEPLTAEGLLRLVQDTGAALRAAGCGANDRVAVVMPNGPDMATACLSLAATSVCVPLNPDYTRSEVRGLMQRLRVTHVVASEGHAAACEAAADLELPLMTIRAVDGAEAGRFVLEGADTPALSNGNHGQSLNGTDRPGPDDIAMVLHTSGSTAEPKIVPLTHRNLLTSAENVARSLGLGPEDVCLSTMPLFHIGALVDLLLAPLAAGGSIVVGRTMTAGDFFEHLERFSPTWYQGVPTVLMDILRRARSDAAVPASTTSLRFVRSVSAPCPVHVLADFEEAFGVPVIEIYGMTETAGVITSNPMPPGQRRAGSVGLPAGPEILIVDAAGDEAAPGRRGEVLVRGANVLAGYETGSGDDIGSEPTAFWNDWFRTGDEGYLDADGYLFLTGRIKELINRGGEKISPVEIDEVVLAHPDVRDAAAFAHPHPTLGEDVALAVVPHAGRTIQRARITAFCSDRLAPFKVPRTIHVCDELPRAPGGKLQRSRLGDWCLPDAQDPEPAVLTTRQARLASIWAELLDTDGATLDDDFFDLGGDSLRGAELVQRLHEDFGVDLPPSALFDHPTLGELDDLLEALLDTTPHEAVDPYEPRLRTPPELLDEMRGFLTAWYGHRPPSTSLLIGWNTRGTRPPVFWGAQNYKELSDFAALVGSDQPVYGMRSLYEARSKSAENIAALARRYLAEIQDVQPEGPLLLGGYCAGAGIAFKIARAFRSRGREVETLCLMEHYTPEAYDGRTAFFFNVDSGWHPFRTVDAPWCELYTGPVRMHPTHATHQGILTDPETVAAVRRELDEAVSLDEAVRLDEPITVDEAITRQQPTGAAPAHELVVKARAPRLTISRRIVTVDVDILNRGTEPVPAGTRIYDRWRRARSTTSLYDDYTVIEEDLEPGARMRTRFQMRLPLPPGHWFLSFDVVVGADMDVGAITSLGKRSVWLLPGSAVVSYFRRRLPWADRQLPSPPQRTHG